MPVSSPLSTTPRGLPRRKGARFMGVRRVGLRLGLQAFLLLGVVAAPAFHASPALADEAPAAGSTRLKLSDAGQVTRTPDLLVAVLRAEARGSDAAVVQEQVNRQMASATAEAKKLSGLVVANGGYNTGRTDTPKGWQASQTLRLQGKDGPALLTLVAKLQGQGLGLVELGWQLSPDAWQAARAEATTLALSGVRQRAEDVAKALGLQFTGFREIQLEGGRPMPMARMGVPVMALAASQKTDPSALPQDATVSVSVDAEAILSGK